MEIEKAEDDEKMERRNDKQFLRRWERSERKNVGLEVKEF